MTRAEFLSGRTHWITKIQIDLYHELEVFMKANNINRTQLAERLGVTKGYMSQVLNGDFDHKVSKLVDLSLLMGKVPEIVYTDLNKYIDKDKRQYADQTLLKQTFEDKSSHPMRFTGMQTQRIAYHKEGAISMQRTTLKISLSTAEKIIDGHLL